MTGIVVLILGFGWLVVRVTRPKTTAAAIGFGVAVAAVASVSEVIVSAPVTVEKGMYGEAYRTGRVHPVGEWDGRGEWLAEAARPGTPARAEWEYLARFLPPEKRLLNYPGWEDDAWALRWEATQVNRLRAGYRAVGEEVLFGSAALVAWAVFSTWVVVYLDRTRGRRWSNVVVYAELTSPIAVAVLVGHRIRRLDR
jgi:hypothetical protein